MFKHPYGFILELSNNMRGENFFFLDNIPGDKFFFWINNFHLITIYLKERQVGFLWTNIDFCP